jgi:hypothetical protein
MADHLAGVVLSVAGQGEEAEPGWGGSRPESSPSTRPGCSLFSIDD